jgi:hypothetical protein
MDTFLSSGPFTYSICKLCLRLSIDRDSKRGQMTSTRILRSEFIQYTGNSDVRTNLANYSTENLSGGEQKIHQNSSEKNLRNSALTRPVLHRILEMNPPTHTFDKMCIS